MTRSSELVREHIFDFDDDFEQTLRRKRNQQASNPPSPEPELEEDEVVQEEEPTAQEVEEAQVMAADNRTIKEPLASGLGNVVPLCIPYPMAAQGKTEEFELKSSLLHHILKYHGLSMEDTNKHLKEFEVVCSSMTPVYVHGSILKMKAFPFSPMDKAKDWLYELAPRTVTSWESMKQAFSEKFFPTSRIILLRKWISCIQQNQGESFPAYYEQFKALVASCPQHQMKEELLIQYFYEALLPIERQMLDALAGRALFDKTSAAAKTLIANRALNALQYEEDGQREAPRQPHVNEVGAISEIKSQLDNLTLLVSQVVDKPKVKENTICAVCSMQGHLNEQCPQLIENRDGKMPMSWAIKAKIIHEMTRTPTLTIWDGEIIQTSSGGNLNNLNNKEDIDSHLPGSIKGHSFHHNLQHNLPNQTQDEKLQFEKENHDKATARKETSLPQPPTPPNPSTTGELKNDGVIIQLADRSNAYPKGVLEDVLVQVNHLIFLADFYVLELEDSAHSSTLPILLGRPFMKTTRTKIDVFKGTLAMEFDKEVIDFNLSKTIKYPSDDHSCFSIDIIDSLAQQYFEDLNEDALETTITK
ncbi:unnamed protein product [Malus baccata var. baccata]